MNPEIKEQIKARFLTELPAPYGEKAANNLEKHPWRESTANIDGKLFYLLLDSFDWAATEEGEEFWDAVYHVLVYDGPEKLKELNGYFKWQNWMVKIYPDSFRIGCTKFEWSALIQVRRIIQGKRKSAEINGGIAEKYTEETLLIGDWYISISSVKELLGKLKRPKK